MKKYILAILLLTLATICYARMPLIVVGGSAQTIYSDCSQRNNAEFYYNVDHASGDTYACDSGGTEVGTWIGSGAAGTAQTSPESGGNHTDSLNVTGNYIDFTTSGGTHFDRTSGKITGYFYPDVNGGADSLVIELEYDSNDYVWVLIDANGGACGLDCFSVYWVGNGTSNDRLSCGQVSFDQWHAFEVEYDVGRTNDDLRCRLCSDGTCDDETWETLSDDITALSGEVIDIFIGGSTAMNHDVYVDDIRFESDQPSW